MKTPRKKPSKHIVLVVLSALAAGLALVVSNTGFLSTIERQTVDLRFRLLGDQRVASDAIVLVAIDDASLKTLEPAVGRWPWQRNVHAVLLDYLARAGARLVIFDLLFTERDLDHPGADDELVETTVATGNSVHAIYLGNQVTGQVAEARLDRWSLPYAGGFDRFPDVQLPLAGIADGALGLGHVTTTLDADGPWRRYLLLAGYDGRLVPSLALGAALAASDRGLEVLAIGDREVTIAGTRIPLDTDWRLPIWFNGGPGTYSRYSFGQLFYSELQIREGQEPGLDPEIFADKIIVVGISAAGLHDLFTTPYSARRGDAGAGLGKMNGFEIHAHVLDDLLHERFLLYAPGWQAVALALLVAAVCLGSILYRGAVATVAGVLVTPLLYLGFVHWDFARHYALPVVAVLLSWLLATLFGLVYQYGIAAAERRNIKRIFSRYVSPDVYRELLENPTAADLGGSRRDMTVLFCDLRGFTTFSEGRAPEAVIAQLNEYFAAMVEVVFAHRGTVDKFVGDMIMALFGAPLDDSDHAENAVRCALAMQRRLADLNRTWRARGLPELASGIGINSGDMVAGNLGSEKIQSYTVIGDNVNLGARIESLCKEFDAEILISDQTASQLGGSYHTRELGEVTVKGKTRPVGILEITMDL